MKLEFIVSVMLTVLLGACGNTANQKNDGPIRECPEEIAISLVEVDKPQ